MKCPKCGSKMQFRTTPPDWYDGDIMTDEEYFECPECGNKVPIDVAEEFLEE